MDIKDKPKLDVRMAYAGMGFLKMMVLESRMVLQMEEIQGP